jgi:hypothetical protein
VIYVALSRIVVEQQFGAIGLNITPARVKIESPRLSMNITSDPPEMTIDRKPPTFEMDFGAYDGGAAESEFEDLGIYDDVGARKGMGDDAVKTAEEIKSEKRSGGAVQKGNRIAAAARRKRILATRSDARQRRAQGGRPKVKWDPGYINVDWSRHRISIDWEGEYIPDITVDPPYSIEVYLRNEPYFRVTVEEGEAPYQAGSRVNQAV